MGPLDQIATWPVGVAAGAVMVVPTAPANTTFPTSSVPRIVEQCGDTDRVFPWASITKLCTTLAVLVATEDGRVTLDDAVGPPGSTLAHLMAHASGLGPSDRTPLMKPGKRRIYSNVGFDIAGEWLADHSGASFPRHLRETVLAPLGIAPECCPDNAAPSHGMEGSLSDLIALGCELLAPSLIDPTTLAAATTTAFPGLPGVLPGFGRFDPCDWGIGFEVQNGKSPHWTGTLCAPSTFGHFGQSGGFLWIDPTVRVACAVLTDTTFGPWAAERWPALSDAVLATHAEQHPTISD